MAEEPTSAIDTVNAMRDRLAAAVPWLDWRTSGHAESAHLYGYTESERSTEPNNHVTITVDSYIWGLGYVVKAFAAYTDEVVETLDDCVDYVELACLHFADRLLSRGLTKPRPDRMAYLQAKHRGMVARAAGLPESVSEVKDRAMEQSQNRHSLEMAVLFAMSESKHEAQREWGRKQWEDHRMGRGGVCPLQNGLDAYFAAAVKAGALRADP